MTRGKGLDSLIPPQDTGEEAEVVEEANEVVQDRSTKPVANAAEETPLRKPTQRTNQRNLIRKEAFIWKKQRNDLFRIARYRDEFRTTEQPRITENTLIRLGIDLLVARADELRGSTEDELRESLGL